MRWVHIRHVFKTAVTDVRRRNGLACVRVYETGELHNSGNTQMLIEMVTGCSIRSKSMCSYVRHCTEREALPSGV
jgi:hypothetical protein